MGRIFVKLFKLLVVRWVLLPITIQMVSSRPVEDSKYIVESTPIFDDEQRYLMEFGYLPKVSDSEISNLLAEDQIIDALRRLQRMGNIPVTGRMDAATKQLMRNRRCGVSDNKESENHRSKRYSLQGHKWNHLDIKWSLRTRHLNSIKHGSVRRDLNRAFKIWSKHSNLQFTEVNSDTADILILFAKGPHEDGNPFDGPGRILAHAFFPGEGRGGDVHFDEEEEWLLGYENNKTGTNLFTVAVHEIGHSLGLFHSSDINSLMFPWYQSLGPDFELPHDDQIAIQILYGPKNGRIWGDYTPYTPNTRVATSRYTTPMTRISTTTKTTTTSTTTTTTTPASTTTTSTTSRTRPPRRPHVEDNKPYFCDTSIDAVSVIRKETYFFKDKYVWRFSRDGRLLDGYPALIEQMWSKLADEKTVDAVYERKDGKIVFFIGRYYYKFDGRDLLDGYPKPLTELGLPEELDHVDAVTIWGFSNKTYIFSGNVYWKYDEKYDKIKELDYPKDMSVWKGVDYNIDAAFQTLNGTTYFFKGRGFWKFNDGRMSVEDRRPRPIGQFWINCTDGGTTSRRERLQTSAPAVASAAAVAYRSADRLLALLLVTLAIVCGRSLPSGTSYPVPAAPSGGRAAAKRTCRPDHGGTTLRISRPRGQGPGSYRAASSSDDRLKSPRPLDACRQLLL